MQTYLAVVRVRSNQFGTLTTFESLPVTSRKLAMRWVAHMIDWFNFNDPSVRIASVSIVQTLNTTK